MTAGPSSMTTSSINQAVLQQAATVLASQPGAGAGPGVGLDPIDLVVDTSQFIVEAIPGDFFDFIVDGLQWFQDLLTDLTGDSGAIQAHVEQLRQLAAAVRAEPSPLLTAQGQALGAWRGGAADAFRTTTDLAVDVEHATADAIDALADAHLRLAGKLAAAKQDLLDTLSDAVGILVDLALQAIVRAGLVITGVIVDLAADVLNAFLDGLRSGGLVGGVVSGTQALFGGAPDVGGEIRRRLAIALDDFIADASDELAALTDRVLAFVQETIEPMVADVADMKAIGNVMERAAALLTTGTDPGNDADAAADGSFGSDARGADPQLPLDGDLIDLNAAIGDPDADLPDGYSRASPQELAALGITPGMLRDDGTGFEAEVFRTPDGDYVVAFAGTTAGAGAGAPDIPEDVIGAGTVSPQTGNVLALTEAISNSGHGDDVVYTGHSLGGRLAAEAALATGNAAVTYNSAGVSDATVDYIAQANGTSAAQLQANADAGQVRSYRTGDDVLTYAQERYRGSENAAPDALGVPIDITPPEGDDNLDGLGEAMHYGEGHVLDNVRERFDQRYGTGDQP